LCSHRLAHGLISAKGAKCNSLGQRPRNGSIKVPSAESAKCC
jgi:hypothetical protein